jgi:ATP-dependent Clp protease protease subunit
MLRPSTGLLAAAGQERRVPLRGRFTKQLASCCIARLLVLATEHQQHPIITYIDSPGGSAAEALALISTMNGIRCPVFTFCHGQAVGPAAIIAAHGFRGCRAAVSSARFSFKGFDSAAKTVDGTELDSLFRLLADIFANDTRKPKEQVLKWFREGIQFNSQEALTNGLIDVISVQPVYPKSNDPDRLV